MANAFRREGSGTGRTPSPSESGAQQGPPSPLLRAVMADEADDGGAARRKGYEQGFARELRKALREELGNLKWRNAIHYFFSVPMLLRGDVPILTFDLSYHVAYLLFLTASSWRAHIIWRPPPPLPDPSFVWPSLLSTWPPPPNPHVSGILLLVLGKMYS